MPETVALDHILSLPAGRELDAVVAEKVMGFQHNVGSQTIPDHWVSPRGDVLLMANLPRYSTSIAAAWEVVEKLLQSYPGFRVQGHISQQSLYPNERRIFWTAGEADDRSDWCESADTAPLAICRAALKAVLK